MFSTKLSGFPPNLYNAKSCLQAHIELFQPFNSTPFFRSIALLWRRGGCVRSMNSDTEYGNRVSMPIHSPSALPLDAVVPTTVRSCLNTGRLYRNSRPRARQGGGRRRVTTTSSGRGRGGREAMTDAAIVSLASLVQILAECLVVATTTGVELSTITTTATTTATTSSSKRRTITGSSGRAEGQYIGIDTLFPYSVPEFINLLHSLIRQRRAMQRKEKALI